MPTFYLDFENGNDANDGTTFANRWKSLTSGATAARIAPGDTIRIMGSPAPTSLGQNGVWTSQALQATKSITGATNATPISITCTSHGYSTGDTVVVTGVAGNTNANGTWEITNTGANTFTLDGSAGNAAYTSGGTASLRNNTRVMLTTAVTQNIACTGAGRANWTSAGGANVTIGFSSSTIKENTTDTINIQAGFTTGLAAYYTLPSTLDLSGYQQVSFWIFQNSGIVGAAGAVDLRLCSDSAGVTAVNTISIPNLATIGRWMPVTVDLGTNLGSSINSIALYVNTDNGSQAFWLSNIIACKASSAADSLTLTSLIGKNTSGETFWGIQSINGRRVMLDADTNATPISATVRGYYGTSETVTTWKRETIKLGPAASSSTALQTIQDSGTDGNPITFSGGWDRTNMSTQSLETWLDGVNGNGRPITGATNRAWINLSNVATCRCNSAFGSDFSYSTLALIAANNSSSGISTSGSRNVYTLNAVVANSTGITTGGSRNAYLAGNLSSNTTGIDAASIGRVVRLSSTGASILCANNQQAASVSDGLYNSINFTANDLGTVNQFQAFAFAYFSDCTFSTDPTVPNGFDAAVFSHKQDGVANNHKIFLTGARISSATDQRHTASGISWKMQPSNSNRSSAWPVTLSLAKVACSANNLVTIKAWMRRDNSGLTMRLVCKGGQIAGVSSDVVSALSTTNAWEEETITFTPTEAGVVEITAEAWGGTTNSGWVDDLTITQA